MAEPIKLEFVITDYPFTCTYCGKEFKSSLTEEDVDDGMLTSPTHCCGECLEKRVDLTKLMRLQ